MRINRLDLVRYGKFTDRSLVFPEPQPGGSDIHIVHGPNEAGKSTLFSAYLDLLFGIELKSAYGFLHGYPALRIGGDFTFAGNRQEVYRLKRNQASLVGADDRSLPDTLFSPVLGGIDRHAYQMMFSLDDDSIEKGGEGILKSEGELGAMLFSASSGLSGITSSLQRMKSETEEFYRPQARKHRLSALKAEVEALREERKQRDVAARDYGSLVRSRDAAAARYDEVLSQRAQTRRQMEALDRQLAAMPLLQRLRDLRAQLATFDLGETPPPEWTALVDRLSREDAELGARIARIDLEGERLDTKLASLSRDEVALAHEAAIGMLAGSGLEARYRTALMDMESRVADRERLSALTGEKLALLQLPPHIDPVTILLPPGSAGALTSHFSLRSGLMERCAAAEREAGEAERVLTLAQQAAQVSEEEGAGDESDRIAALSTICRAVRAGGISARCREAERAVATEAEALADALARLWPWQGEEQNLSALLVPSPAERQQLRVELDASKEKRRRILGQIADLESDLAVRLASLSRLRRSEGLVSDDEATELRSARDAAWRQHLASLDRGSADIFASAMEADDRGTAKRLTQTERHSEMRLEERAVVEAETRLYGLRNAADAVEKERQALEERIRATVVILGLAADTSLDALEAWLARREAALELRARHVRAKAELSVCRKEAAEAETRLRDLLGLADDTARLDELLLLAEDRATMLVEVRAQKHAAGENLKVARIRNNERRAELEEARAAIATWNANWCSLLAGTWLSALPEPPAPEQVSAMLPVLQDLAKLVDNARDLDHRIAGMRRDREQFSEAIAMLAKKLGMPEASSDPLDGLATMSARLQAAKETEGYRARAEADRAKLHEEARELQERRAVHEARSAEICAFLRCDGLVEAAALLAQHARRRDVLARLDQAGSDVARQLLVATEEEAEAILAAVDEPQLVAERSELQALFDDQDREVRDLHVVRTKAADDLARIGDDDTVARIDEHQKTLLLELADRARRYLSNQAGILAAEQALRLYRERHRSAMMDRASEAFRLISGGEYTGLATVAEKDSELLIVNAAAGGSKLARDLSKGTRFQLYFALRVAGYHEIAANREILPFIADDIMETFDDERALNTFRLMGQMAKTGQVIYLTHHQHLRDIARQACPDVVVHEL